MQIIVTIVPIFVIIMLGWGARKRGSITQEFLGPANKLVFYLSIPAMIFSAIVKSDFHEQFDGKLLLLTLLSTTLVYGIGDVTARLLRMSPARSGAFVQSSGHGNLGYIGLPIAFYYLGDAGLAKASIICGFMMILQNLLSVIALQIHDPGDPGKTGPGTEAETGPREAQAEKDAAKTKRSRRLDGIKNVLLKLIGNPVIIGGMSGILVSALGIPVPEVVSRCLKILGGLAPPMALLLIGASVSIKLMRLYLRPILGAVAYKLLLLPVIGLTIYHFGGISIHDALPALILLCSPTATVAYVMAREMRADADFAVATISASTLLSSFTFMLWLAMATSWPVF